MIRLPGNSSRTSTQATRVPITAPIAAVTSETPSVVASARNASVLVTDCQKLDGLWLRLRFLDGDSLEGVLPNDLLSLMDNGLQITPPDLNSNTDRIFVPRSAISSLTVLGVVGIARRKPATAATAAQPKLFSE